MKKEKLIKKFSSFASALVTSIDSGAYRSQMIETFDEKWPP
jgi:hypothetical protein